MALKAHSIRQALEHVPFGQTTLRAKIKSGELVARRIGRKLIILDEDLQKFILDLPKR